MATENLNTHKLSEAISETLNYLQKAAICSKAKLHIINYLGEKWEFAFEVEGEAGQHGMAILSYDIDTQITTIEKVDYDAAKS